MTTNVQLDNYVRSHPQKFLNQTFLGVFSADALPKINGQRNCSLIVNYSPADKEGTHWCAMRQLNSNQPVEFFGSYGLSPSQVYKILGWQDDFEAYMQENSNGHGFVYNTIDLQSWKKGENECGEWALLFLEEGLPDYNNKVWTYFLAMHDKIKRDDMVKRYIGIRK